jgi:hypothetical protein
MLEKSSVALGNRSNPLRSFPKLARRGGQALGTRELTSHPSKGLAGNDQEHDHEHEPFQQAQGPEALEGQEGTGLTSHPGKSRGAGWVALRAGLSEDGIAALHERVEGRVFASETLRGGAKESEA